MKSLVILAALAVPLSAQTVETTQLSENGWFSDDTRADGTGTEPAGTNLISDTLTDDPEATASGTPTHDADIQNQISFGIAPGTVPDGTHPGAVNLSIAPGVVPGKSQISHRKDDGTGHAPGSVFAPGMEIEYSWMGDGTSSITASLKFGIKTADFGSTGVSSRTGENAWDKVLIYEPGQGNGKTSDGTWQTETIDFTTGEWWFFDRTVGAGSQSQPATLSFMSTSTSTFAGSKTLQDVYNLITAPGAHITSVQFGIGSNNPGGNVYVNELTTNFYRAGSTTTFGCADYEQGFEVDDFGWNVFGAGFETFRVPSGTNGITSAAGAWHAEGVNSAGNWGGYGGTCGCSSTTCASGMFPEGGYRTSLDIYLDVDAGFANDSRFDFSSAINDTTGTHRRDFIFNASFLDTTEVSSVGAGTNRWVVAASNNSIGFPQGGVDPIAIGTSGWYTFEHRFYDSGGGVLACDFTIYDTAGAIVATWTRSNATDVIGVTVGGNRYAWFPYNELPFIAYDNARRTVGPESGDLVLTAADCQDDAFPGEAGTQIEVDLSMVLDGSVTGFAAFVDYDDTTLSYRGDLSSYSASPFPLHIGPIAQADDGRLELDGSVAFGGTPTATDASLATLVFDVDVECGVATPISFESGGAFPSELSKGGEPLVTALVDPAPFTLDDTPPVLDPCPADIVQNADAGSCDGAIVTFSAPGATDNCDPSPSVVCTPASGSLFPVGTTTVTCTATDACGNQTSCTFDVEVTGFTLVDVEVVLTDSVDATRCIHFVVDDCSVTADVSLVFTGAPAPPATSIATIEIPCGAWTEICAKDRQHTKWATSPLTISGAKYVATTPLVLDAGDTDDDGDVDINDVTLFLAQFGNAASPGGCPYDGITKDADFSNDTVVGAADYVPLTNNWLTTSLCPCTVPAVGRMPPMGRLQQRLRVYDDPVAMRADLDGDGFVDVLDVELFEQRHGLPGTLSQRMHATAGR